MGRGWGGTVVVLVAALVVLLGFAAPLQAEVRRLEAIGAVPIDPSDARTALRDRAIQRALREAVSRVASEIMLEAEAPPGGIGLDPADGEEPAYDEILGAQMVHYTSSFRIVEDRGEKPAMFSEDPEITMEYVVIVDVQVEVERVRERLVQAGLLIEDDPQVGPARQFRLLAEGLTRYGAYESFLTLLVEQSGAEAVSPAYFEPGSVGFLVTADEAPREFMWRLIERRPPELQIEPVGGDAGGPEDPEGPLKSGDAPAETSGADVVRVAVHWTPPPPGPDPDGPESGGRRRP